MPSEYYEPLFESSDGDHILVSTNALLKRPKSYAKTVEKPRLRPQELAGQMSFARDRTIFSEGEHAAHLYKVVSGAVRLCNYMRDGRRQVADFVFPNDYFGILPQADYCDTAEAASDVIVIRYPYPAIVSLDERQGGTIPSRNFLDFRRHLLQLLSQRVRATQRHLLLLGKKTAQERIATLLVTLFERLGSTRGKPFVVPLSRRDMADYLGLTMETVSRGLTQFRRKHFIDVPERHYIVINNFNALCGLAAGGSGISRWDREV